MKTDMTHKAAGRLIAARAILLSIGIARPRQFAFPGLPEAKREPGLGDNESEPVTALRRTVPWLRLIRRSVRRGPPSSRPEEMSDHALRDIGLSRVHGPTDIRDRLWF